MRYSSIILDLDGTLVDTSRALTRGLNETLAHLGRRHVSEEQVRRHANHGLRALLRAACHLTGRALSDAELNAGLVHFRARYDHWLLDLSTLHDGAIEAMQTLQDAGARQSVLTNKPAAPALRLVQTFGLDRFLDFVVTGDMGLPHKPDPSGLLLLLDKLDTDPAHAVFVGSSRVDARTASNAGVRAALCNPSAGRARLLAIGADYVLDDISQLLPLATGQLSAVDG
ncbi:MAG: HAD hydrolase-like protein [Myxococcales bacterium]|nr:HAD hydrolase-like protein [Myxococcales bacterium]